MTIYIDELFAMNAVSCAAMLCAFAKITGLHVIRMRMAMAAAAGGLIAALRFVCGSALSWVFGAAEIILVPIAFPKAGIKKTLLFILIKYAFSGFAVLCVSFMGGSAAVIRGGIVYFDISLPVFALAFAGIYTLIYVFAALIKKRGRKMYTLKISAGGGCVELRTLYDSGNLLKNPYDGTPVIVAEKAAVKDIWDGRFVLIPFRAVGTQNGMIKAFGADSVYCVENGQTAKKVTIGIIENILSKNGGAEALIGPGFFKEEL